MPSYKASEPKQAGRYNVDPGVYKIEIVNATEKLSQSGNPMIRLVCEVKLGDGTKGPEIWDHLVFTPKASWKIDQVRAALGQAVVPGESVDIEAEDFVGKTAFAQIGETEGNEGDAKFNTIERWIFGSELEKIKAKGTHAVAKANAYKPEDNDDIPF
jgi:hypothetical protein